MPLKLVKFNVDCGRMGELSGVFAATQEDLDEIVGEVIEFGEILGKHSDVSIEIEASHFTVVDNVPEDVVTLLVKELGSPSFGGAYTFGGVNPFDYWEEE